MSLPRTPRSSAQRRLGPRLPELLARPRTKQWPPHAPLARSSTSETTRIPLHTDGGLAFGEGWYLAAAAVLAGVTIQIEPGKPATPQAEKFLRDAGLGDQLQVYRSRPRANKHTTDIVARAFRDEPASAQRSLRAAFLGEEPISAAVAAWIDRWLVGRSTQKKVLLASGSAPCRGTRRSCGTLAISSV